MTTTESSYRFCRELVERFGVLHPAGWKTGMSDFTFDELSSKRHKHFDEIARVLEGVALDEDHARRIVHLWIDSHRCWPTIPEIVELAQSKRSTGFVNLEDAIGFLDREVRYLQQVQPVLQNLDANLVTVESLVDLLVVIDRLGDDRRRIQKWIIGKITEISDKGWDPSRSQEEVVQ